MTVELQPFSWLSNLTCHIACYVRIVKKSTKQNTDKKSWCPLSKSSLPTQWLWKVVSKLGHMWLCNDSDKIIIIIVNHTKGGTKKMRIIPPLYSTSKRNKNWFAKLKHIKNQRSCNIWRQSIPKPTNNIKKSSRKLKCRR